jgi:hypothetical protein
LSSEHCLKPHFRMGCPGCLNPALTHSECRLKPGLRVQRVHPTHALLMVHEGALLGVGTLPRVQKTALRWVQAPSERGCST